MCVVDNQTQADLTCYYEYILTHKSYMFRCMINKQHIDHTYSDIFMIIHHVQINKQHIDHTYSSDHTSVHTY